MIRKYIVDRLIENFAVCYDQMQNKIDIPIEKLPKKINEGDVLIFDGKSYLIDLKETKRLRKENIELQNSLFDK